MTGLTVLRAGFLSGVYRIVVHYPLAILILSPSLSVCYPYLYCLYPCYPVPFSSHYLTHQSITTTATNLTPHQPAHRTTATTTPKQLHLNERNEADAQRHHGCRWHSFAIAQDLTSQQLDGFAESTTTPWLEHSITGLTATGRPTGPLMNCWHLGNILPIG